MDPEPEVGMGTLEPQAWDLLAAAGRQLLVSWVGVEAGWAQPPLSFQIGRRPAKAPAFHCGVVGSRIGLRSSAIATCTARRCNMPDAAFCRLLAVVRSITHPKLTIFCQRRSFILRVQNGRCRPEAFPDVRQRLEAVWRLLSARICTHVWSVLIGFLYICHGGREYDS